MVMTQEREEIVQEIEDLKRKIAETEVERDLQLQIIEEIKAKWNTNYDKWPIEFWRERAGDMTQEELAILSDVSHATISKAERGLPIARKTFFMIARGLGVSPGLIRINLLPSTPKKEES